MSNHCLLFLKASRITARAHGTPTDKGCAVLGTGFGDFIVERPNGTQIEVGRAHCKYCARAEAISKMVRAGMNTQLGWNVETEYQSAEKQVRTGWHTLSVDGDYVGRVKSENALEIMSALAAHALLKRLADMLSGQEWNSGHLEVVATALNDAGYAILPPGEEGGA
jgi:hypothetical protein